MRIAKSVVVLNDVKIGFVACITYCMNVQIDERMCEEELCSTNVRCRKKREMLW